MNRGDVVIVDFPFTDQRQSKLRPALIVQSDADNARRKKTIVALITGNLRRDGEATQLLVDPATPEGSSSGLHGPSLVSCNDLFTIEQRGVIRTIGRLSDAMMSRVDDGLQAALGLS